METMVKVGPHNVRWGQSWDDKGQSMVTSILITYGSEWINSIQTAYMRDGKLQLSEKHGGNGEIFNNVKITDERPNDCLFLVNLPVQIDYPSEFLTGIKGFTDSSALLKCLTFETNLRKFGPFGQEKGKAFHIQMGSTNSFGGFHGRSDSNYMYSIGVYVKLINPLQDTILREEESQKKVSQCIKEEKASQ
ncbi:hypothetical protein NE237_022259 [Protea cynaroides]|uniref:Jacalin-type lectin domain-containing protein n=1 Tax=Protea cynaroides TaxID=273540 RepID=A0A9Q0HCV0_9MAGN|nr:hypothetical protein NE237_022259 [Protea cynaroides]